MNIHLQKSETGLLSYIIHISELKMEGHLSMKPLVVMEPLESDRESKLLDVVLITGFMGVTTKAQATKGKRQVAL